MKKETLISKAKYLFATGFLMAFNAVNVFAQSKLNSGLQNATNEINPITAKPIALLA